MKNIFKPKTVVQSNTLINASYRLTTNEKRLIYMMIRGINPNDKDFKPYSISIDELSKILESNSKNLYKVIKSTADSLTDRKLKLETKEGWLIVNFVSSAEYKKDDGLVELSFDPKLKPYLLEVKERFTKFNIENVIPLRSAHSMRIYELLKQYHTIGQRTLQVDEVKRTLGIEEKYSKYTDFRKRVIERARIDLKQKTDLSFEYEEIKTGRSVTAIRFFISENAKARHKLDKIVTSKSVFGTLEENLYYQVYDDLKSFGFTDKELIDYLEKKPIELLQDVIKTTNLKLENNKITKSAKAFAKALIDTGKVITPKEKQSSIEQERNAKLARTKKANRDYGDRYYSEYKQMKSNELDTSIAIITEEEKQQVFYKVPPESRRFLTKNGSIDVSSTYFRSEFAKENNIKPSNQEFIFWVKNKYNKNVREYSVKEVRNSVFDTYQGWEIT